MSENKSPVIQPIKLKEFDTKQSKYNMVPHLPFRSVVLGPSGSGKHHPASEYDPRHLPQLLQPHIRLQPVHQRGYDMGACEALH